MSQRTRIQTHAGEAEGSILKLIAKHIELFALGAVLRRQCFRRGVSAPLAFETGSQNPSQLLPQSCQELFLGGLHVFALLPRGMSEARRSCAVRKQPGKLGPILARPFPKYLQNLDELFRK